ncbi:hypothetical protein DIPPA_06600 [Diplonema papillatum]|nr:hypothetical protein DIPPA_06600 [Diplonema papillatum]
MKNKLTMQHRWLLVWAACLVEPAAGNIKLWELGDKANENPITVYMMFCFSVCITVCIETMKHTTERRLKDKYRRQALNAIYTQLMMLGIVSFLLILSAEVGLLDIRLDIKGDCDDFPEVEKPSNGSASGSASTSDASSGSGSACGLGFDIVLFEYAHLVLFFMGLIYCAFIMIAFWQRDQLCDSVREYQKKTLVAWYEKKPKPSSVPGIMGFPFKREAWARSVLTMRAAIIVEHAEEIKAICDPRRVYHEDEIAKHRRQPVPESLPEQRDAFHHFDMARFCHIAMSEVLLELLHIPPLVWITILVIAAGNLIHRSGVTLAAALVVTSFIGPLLSIFLLWRLSIQLGLLIHRSAGHPQIAMVEFHDAVSGADDADGEAHPPSQKINIEPRFAALGRMWSEGGEDPWAILTGCIPDDSMFNDFDPLDPGALEHQIQAVIFVSCFYIGQLSMLTSLMFGELGALGIVCWLMPLPPLLFFIPRSLLLYTLVHRTKNPPSAWLRYALQKRDSDPGTALVGTDFHSDDESDYSYVPDEDEDDEQDEASFPARPSTPPHTNLYPPSAAVSNDRSTVKSPLFSSPSGSHAMPFSTPVSPAFSLSEPHFPDGQHTPKARLAPRTVQQRLSVQAPSRQGFDRLTVN